jgi:pimeloyl-ACP methyl ester carboxylesterase
VDRAPERTSIQAPPGPGATERVEGASHWIQLDRPDHVNRLLLDFLGESSSADRPAQ